MSDIEKNLNEVHAKISKACACVGQKIRDASEVNLLAVSKKQPIEKIKEMIGCGHILYGENRVQEAQERWNDLKPLYPDLKLHLIGPLQTNKVKDAVTLFDVIHTLDRPKIVLALSKEMKKQKKFLPCFIQVNTGEEKQKSGILPSELPDFLKLCRDEGLDIIGLMCIPPADEPAALHFAFLKKLAEENDLPELSMGMSHDFDKAIIVGATYVRVGTALFGAREAIA